MHEPAHDDPRNASNQHRDGLATEPGWADAARAALAVGIMVAMLVMWSFMLAGERLVAYTASAAGLVFVAGIPLVEWAVDREWIAPHARPQHRTGRRI
ncbi:hypothetical protein [Tsukamurella hominis]|uniref:hypothetical protein n=1 Tax=Tsukamurella hominis TaxID=1970232 RepID=UPI0039E99DAB